MTAARLLDGLRVLDLAGEGLAYAGRMFADLGADVVLVEPPGGSTARHVPPLATTSSGDIVSAHFAYMAAGKRSLTLDLDSRTGGDLFRKLLAQADVLLASPPRGELDVAGLDWTGLNALNPRLVVTALTPFGLRGPRRRWLGSDLVGWASSGVLPSVGDPDRAPLVPAGGLAYATGALNAAMGTMLALRSRRRTGRGQLVDISLQEAVISVSLEAGPLVHMETGTRGGRTGRRRDTPPIGHYRASDGAVSIVAYMPWQWDALAEWIREETGNEEITLDVFKGTPNGRTPFAEIVDPWIEALTSRYTKQQFFEEAQRRGIPAAPVNSLDDLLVDPHLQATEAWRDVDDPVLGRVRHPRPPISFDGEAGNVTTFPAVGQHTRAVLTDLLGLTEQDMRALRVEGVV